MAPHRVFLPNAVLADEINEVQGHLPDPGSSVRVLGEEAHHAVRVKRLEPGEPVELLDGAGGVITTRYKGADRLGKREGWAIDLIVESACRVPRVSPTVEVRCPAPKGAKLEQLIDQLAQIGAASWGPVATKRAVSEPRAGKVQRLERIAGEASKQCGRAWNLEILHGDRFEGLVNPPEQGATVIADASGVQYECDGDPASPIRLLVGPEGGFTRGELARAEDAGARIVRFGPHVMRIETAAVVAASVVLDRHRAAYEAVHSGKADQEDQIG
ncbi:MAG: RsmE family RNA methyltransferase [Planctomycetota bacterium]